MKCCRLSCRYPNGVVAIIVAQVFMIFGLLASVVVIGDCFLVIIEDIPNLFPNERPNLNVIRGLGFFFYEDIDGECSWDSDESYQEYQGNQGTDWRTPRGMAIGASCGAYVALVALFSMSCCNFRTIPRTVLGVFISCVLPFFQALVYTVVQTDLCRDFGCALGRTAIFNGVATGCFILSGIAVFCTRNYDKDRDPLWCKSPQAATTKETPIEEMSILENEEICGLSKDSISPAGLGKRRLFGDEPENTSSSTDDIEEQLPRPESSRQYLTKIVESEDEDDVETTIFPQDKDLEFHDDGDEAELFPAVSPAMSPVYTFHDGEEEFDDTYPFPSDSRLQQPPASGDIEVLLGGSYERSDSELESLDGSERSPTTPPRQRRRRRKTRS